MKIRQELFELSCTITLVFMQRSLIDGYLLLAPRSAERTRAKKNKADIQGGPN